MATEQHAEVETTVRSRRRCPVCHEDLMLAAMTDVVTTHEPCDCAEESFTHLHEQLWHRACFVADNQGLST